MAKSKITKKWSALALIFTALSIACMFGPLAYFSITAFIGGAAIIEKFALCSTLLVVGILTVMSAIGKWACRSRIYIILIGLSLCLDAFLPMFYIFAFTQIADELIIHPIASYCRERKRTNADIDKRMS